MKHTSKYIFTMLLCSVFIFTSCYTWFEDKIRMDTETPQISLTDFLYEAPKITNLDPPEQLIVSQGLYSGIIKLHWTDVPNATSYRIERAVVSADSNGNYPIPEEGDFSVLEKYVFHTNYSDHILSDPKSNSDYSKLYYYRVSAENIVKGYESSDFTDYTAEETFGLGWLLAPPQNISAWKGKKEDSIQISWEKVPKARSYQIYRGEKSNGTGMELLDTVKANQNVFLNSIEPIEQGTEFYYKVVAVLGNDSLSAPTGLALGYTRKEGAPEPPDSITIENGRGQSLSSIKIKWEPAADKENYKTLYSVFRSSSTNSILKQIKKETSETSVVDSDNLEPGVIYYYYVQSIYKNDIDFLKSKFSDTGSEPEDDGETAYGYLLSAPSDVEVTDGSTKDKVTIKWTPAIRYVKEESTDPFTYIIQISDSLSADSFVDFEEITSIPEISEGYYSYEVSKKNFYRIITVNSDGLRSEPSYIVAPTPEAPETVTVTKTSALTGLENYNYNTNEVYPVKITWTKPADDNPDGYYIYRSTSPDSGYRRITDLPLSASSTSFIDENETARPGTYYYYKVVSLNVLGQGKKGNVDYGYGAITRDQWFREYNKTIMSSQAKLTLMHKSNDMDKLGSETIKGKFSGTLSYNAKIAGLGAEITMHYQDYCDFVDSFDNPYYKLTGNTDTTSNMSANGNMHEKVTCTGMYPGYAIYNNLQIKGGAAGGGYYLVETYDQTGSIILPEGNVDWTVGEQH